jgi:hypothetical protein
METQGIRIAGVVVVPFGRRTGCWRRRKDQRFAGMVVDVGLAAFVALPVFLSRRERRVPPRFLLVRHANFHLLAAVLLLLLELGCVLGSSMDGAQLVSVLLPFPL